MIRSGALLVACVLMLALPESAAAVLPQGNMVKDGDLESTTGGTTSAGTACPAAFYECGPAMPEPKVVRYGAQSMPSLADGARIGGGANFFSGGPGTDSSGANQFLDLTQAKPEIDAGNAQLTLSACLGGYKTEGDDAELWIAFSSGVQTAVLKTPDRGGVTGLLPVSTTASIPPTTTSMYLFLRFRRTFGTYDDGYADNLTVNVGPPGLPPPAVKCGVTGVGAPGNSPLNPSSTTKDTTKPTLFGLGFSRGTFRAAKSGAAISRKRRVKIGTKVSFSLSESSAVKFTAQRSTRGRRVAGKCRAKTRKNRAKKACTRWVAVKGSFATTRKAGKSSFTFRGRMGGKALRPGRYRLSALATDPSDNQGLPRRKGFRIVR